MIPTVSRHWEPARRPRGAGRARIAVGPCRDRVAGIGPVGGVTGGRRRALAADRPGDRHGHDHDDREPGDADAATSGRGANRSSSSPPIR